MTTQLSIPARKPDHSRKLHRAIDELRIARATYKNAGYSMPVKLCYSPRSRKYFVSVWFSDNYIINVQNCQIIINAEELKR